MKVCVVGGTGNISTSIVRLLLEVGHEVTVFNRGRSAGLPAGVRVIQGDRKERAAFEAAMQGERFGAAIDMICFDAEDARSTIRAFHGVQHLIHCSTVCTYGVQSDWLPVTEDHPLRPTTDYGRNKVAADRVFTEAFWREGLPVTIMKPSSTFGPRWPLLRQIAWDDKCLWIDRIRKGKPIVICGDGRALHQWLYVDDAAAAFVFALGRQRCIGQTYNLTKKEFGSWAEYHRTAMRVVGREVDMVGVPLSSLLAAGVPDVGICETVFSHNNVYSPDKLMRDVPEFRPQVSLQELMERVLEAMDRENRVGDSDKEEWEDRLIAAQRKVGEVKLS
jgi:nucleoside-diphosphate-sugar epimerase